MFSICNYYYYYYFVVVIVSARSCSVRVNFIKSIRSFKTFGFVTARCFHRRGGWAPGPGEPADRPRA